MCVQGMIHISELSWDRIATPEAVVRPGDEVRCKILKVDKARSRISLSLKVRVSMIRRCQPVMMSMVVQVVG